MINLVFDGVLIFLIIILLIYAIRLNTRLKNFQNASAEMANMIGKLNQVITASQHSVATLKETVQKEEGRLSSKIKDAQTMLDELSFVTETGENLASRIEKGLIPSKGNKQNKTSNFDEISTDKEIRETLKSIR